MCDCDDCNGTGETTYLHSDSREWGPDFRDCPCETCNGEGEVEHKCPKCGESHEQECCDLCEGCKACCSCRTCSECGEKIQDGIGVVEWEHLEWCRTCIEAAYGPWCVENEKPCVECDLEEACKVCSKKVEREQWQAADAAEDT
jgi:hypothetical protein